MYCNQCGAENKDASKFCRKCGVPLSKPKETTIATQTQPITTTTKSADTTTPVTTTNGLQPNVAGLLSYALGCLTGIIFLLIEKKDEFVRFHAWQSIITFGILSIPLIILNSIPPLGGLIYQSLIVIYWMIFVLALVLWVFLMFKAYRGEAYKLPVAGEIAKRLLERG